MKSLNQYIKEKLIVNKDYHDNVIVVKSFDELRKIIVDRYYKLGPGTKQNPIDFNDIDVSNIDSFYDHKGIFEGTKFKHIDISDWDVSNIKSMYSIFDECNELESVGDISNWNVSSVINMARMFYGCNELKFIGDISNWNVSSVINMSSMFDGYNNFNQDISEWNVSNARYHAYMFENCPIKDEYKPKFK